MLRFLLISIILLIREWERDLLELINPIVTSKYFNICAVSFLCIFVGLLPLGEGRKFEKKKADKNLSTCGNSLVESSEEKDKNISSRVPKYIIKNYKLEWFRQLLFDCFIYILPITCFGIFSPRLQALSHVISFTLTFSLPVYDYLSIYFFLIQSPPEDPKKAEERLSTYLYNGAYVNGWFRLLWSDELKKGDVKYVYVLNKHFAVFRGEDNKVRCIDAYCVHLGANMAIGGKVVGNCLQCPFHRWEYDGEGECVKIPYQPVIPPATRTKSYHVVEYYSMIIVWYHALDKPPEYFPPSIEGLDNGSFIYKGRRDSVINMHMNEFAENSADFMHFACLHEDFTLPFTPICVPGVKVTHVPGWREGDGTNRHTLTFSDDANLRFFGKDFPSTAAKAEITFVGPGGLVFFSFKTPLGSLVLFHTHTPATPLRTVTSFRWYADSRMPRLLVYYVVGAWIAQWRNDIMVWENKKYLAAPKLVKGDGPIMKQRRWFKQFYTPRVVVKEVQESEQAAEDKSLSSERAADW